LERYSNGNQVCSLQSVLQKDLKILVMRSMFVRELVTYPERVAPSLRIESRSGLVPLVNLRLNVRVSTVHYCTAPFPHPPPVTQRVQVRLYSVNNDVVELSTDLRWPCRLAQTPLEMIEAR
jgi:hypothetical protein